MWQAPIFLALPIPLATSEGAGHNIRKTNMAERERAERGMRRERGVWKAAAKKTGAATYLPQTAPAG